MGILLIIVSSLLQPIPTIIVGRQKLLDNCEFIIVSDKDNI